MMRLYTKLLRYLYTLIYFIAIPAILTRLLWKSRRNPHYRKRWNERFGYFKRLPKDQSSIWVHAVSVGETIAAIPLIRELKKQYPDHAIIVTTTTPTGSVQVKKELKDEVYHVYTPYDIPIFVNRFLRRCNAKLCIIMETELWPNMLRCCRARNIPLVLANARLSKRSKRNYQLISNITKSMLDNYNLVAAQGLLDGERFIELGLDPKRLMISGNIKFDMDLPNSLVEQGRALRQAWGSSHRPTFIAASTHEGEEAILIDAYQRFRKEVPNALLIIVPRHPERFDKVADLIAENNLQFVRKSTNDTPQTNTNIILGDTMGELRMIYAACDIAFVGGSLVPIGGHNLIEPAALGLPILTGPYLDNFTEISKLLKDAGAAQITPDAKAISDALVALFSAKELREKMGARAKDVINSNKGAVQKHIEWIQNIFPSANAENKTVPIKKYYPVM